MKTQLSVGIAAIALLVCFTDPRVADGAVPDVAVAPVTAPKGIAIANSTAVAQAQGGHGHELQNVRAMLSSYGKASLDTQPHPEISIFPGVRYLMPWHEAEKVLVGGNTMMRRGDKIACAGFPEGLNWVCYDGRWVVNGHDYNHLMILKDIDSQVVAIEFLQEHGSWLQPPPWVGLPGDWHVVDYINAEVKGQPGIHIDTQVLDERASNQRIVAHTTSGKIKHTATLYLPQPLINLMLYCTRFVASK